MPALAALVGKADLAFTRAEGGEDSVCLRHGCCLYMCGGVWEEALDPHTSVATR